MRPPEAPVQCAGKPGQKQEPLKDAQMGIAQRLQHLLEFVLGPKRCEIT